MSQTFLLFFLFVISFFYFFRPIYLNNKKRELFELRNTVDLSSNYFVEDNNNIILFTMYNITKRNSMTNDILNYYVNHLKFPKKRIFIVDSSNNGVNYNLVYKENQVVFNQNEYTTHSDSTNLEILALNKFIKDKYYQILNYKYLIKITCKYKLPELLDLDLSNINCDLIVQYKKSLSHINTEILGIKISHIKKILQMITNETGILENRFGKILNKNKLSYKYFTKLQNLANYKRGDGSFMKKL